MKRRNQNTREASVEKKNPTNYKGKKSKPYNKGNRHAGSKDSRDTSTTDVLDKGDRANDPNYYFTDRMLADQVTQMSFQNLAGYPLVIGDDEFEVPNIVTIALNPAPGVTKSKDYGSASLNKMAGINLAGFKLLQMLAAFTGRTTTYGPQDVSVMILGLGEISSMIEVIRRMFGVAFTINMRNRSYPRAILNDGMKVDAEDLFENFSDYRTRFNGLITLVNQLPIPKNIEYLRKCKEMYERIFLDQSSAMAQTLIPMPFTTWKLDEQSYEGGTILKTVPVISNDVFNDVVATPKKMSEYLDILDEMIGLMLNSSTLQYVYTDLLNLATKMKVEFTTFDLLGEGYIVVPEYNAGFSLQMHNATIAGSPEHQTEAVFSEDINVTPYNDVYPNANTNSLYYNPAFTKLLGLENGGPRTGENVVIDYMNDNPSVEDRVEVTRYTSISGQNPIPNSVKLIDAVLPDHYVVSITFHTHLSQDESPMEHSFQATNLPNWNEELAKYVFKEAACLSSNIDWAPRFYEVNRADGKYTGFATGDLNFYTVIDSKWLDKVNQFIALGLYILR